MKKSYVMVIGIVIAVVYAALFFTMDNELDKMKRQLRQMEMIGAAGTGANFYPASGGLEGTGTGALGKITSTADKDAAIVMFNDNAIWGNAFFPYTLDVDGGPRSGATPFAVTSGDGGNELWELTDIHGKRMFSHIQVINVDAACTIGSTCDGALTRLAQGGILYITTSGVTVTLPEVVDIGSGTSLAVEVGASLCIMSGETDNMRFWIDPNANDCIILSGAKDSAGDPIVNAATNSGGDYACMVAVKPDAWLVVGYSGTWTAQ